MTISRRDIEVFGVSKPNILLRALDPINFYFLSNEDMSLSEKAKNMSVDYESAKRMLSALNRCGVIEKRRENINFYEIFPDTDTGLTEEELYEKYGGRLDPFNKILCRFLKDGRIVENEVQGEKRYFLNDGVVKGNIYREFAYTVKDILKDYEGSGYVSIKMSEITKKLNEEGIKVNTKMLSNMLNKIRKEKGLNQGDFKMENTSSCKRLKVNKEMFDRAMEED
jgi:DNA-binding MarR family transcriptional regulator